MSYNYSVTKYAVNFGKMKGFFIMKKVDIKQTVLYGFVIVMAVLEILAGLIGFIVCVADGSEDIGFIFIASAVVAILWLFFNLSIAAHFYQAAFDKGYSDTFYLNLAFFFPFGGYLLVIALPDRGNVTDETQASVETDDLPEL